MPIEFHSTFSNTNPKVYNQLKHLKWIHNLTIVKIINILLFLNYSIQLIQSIRSSLVNLNVFYLDIEWYIISLNFKKLFYWLSQECQKQNINREAFALSCNYVDLFFMKQNDIQKTEDYQFLALGALLLACKLVLTSGKSVQINHNLISLDRLQQMQVIIAKGLNYDLNPLNYIDMLDILGKIWDNKCNQEDAYVQIRYFNNTIASFKKMKTVYEIFDCLYQFPQILDYHISEITLSIFYGITKLFYLKQKKIENKQHHMLLQSMRWKNKWADKFQRFFAQILIKNQIKTQVNNKLVEKVALLKDFKISYTDQSMNPEILSQVYFRQTFNKQGLDQVLQLYAKKILNFKK